MKTSVRLMQRFQGFYSLELIRLNEEVSAIVPSGAKRDTERVHVYLS